WSVEGNFLPVANSPRTRWVGWRPRLKNASRPVCPAVGVTPNEATVIRPISSSQRETVPRRLGSRGTRAPCDRRDRERSEVERPAEHNEQRERPFSTTSGPPCEPLQVRGLDPDAHLPKLDVAGSAPVARSS